MSRAVCGGGGGLWYLAVCGAGEVRCLACRGAPPFHVHCGQTSIGKHPHLDSFVWCVTRVPSLNVSDCGAKSLSRDAEMKRDLCATGWAVPFPGDVLNLAIIWCDDEDFAASLPRARRRACEG